MKNWYSISARGASAVEIVIYNEIGAWGITAKQFIDEFKKVPSNARVMLRINSPGGDVFDALAIYNVLKRHEGGVDGTVDGLAASAASVIAMAAGHLSIPENCFLMIHNAAGMALGTASDMRELADILEKIDNSLVGIYAARTGQPEEKIKELLNAETWLTGQEAKDLGFADEVLADTAIAAFFDLGKFQRPPASISSKAPPVPTPAPPVPPPPPVDIDAIRNEAIAVESKRAIDVVAACAAVSRAELAGEIIAMGLGAEEARAFLADPKKIAMLKTVAAADELKKIYSLCDGAGVPELAPQFVAECRSAAWVKDRLKDADSIRARCLAAGRPERGNGYIRGGLFPEEVSANLFEILLACQSPEINNSLSPDAMMGVTSNETEPTARPRPRMMTNAEVYAQRNRRPDADHEKVVSLLREITRR